MTTTVSQHSEHPCDLADGDIVRTMIALSNELPDTGQHQLRIARFGVVVSDADIASGTPSTLFDGSVDREKLRTLTDVKLTIGHPDTDSVTVAYSRSGAHPTLNFLPSATHELSQRESVAEQRTHEIQTRLHQLQQHGGRNDPQRQAAENELIQARAAQAAASAALTAAIPRQLALLLTCVDAAHRVGLVRPPTVASDGQPKVGAAEALSDEVAALRGNIASLQRNDVEQRARAAAEYEDQKAALKREFDERSARLQDEQLARESRSKALVDEKESEILEREAKLAEREATLDMHDERAARRAMRKEIQQAVKARSENPELSPDAQKAFSRVVRFSTWTIGISAGTLLLAVLGPALIEASGRTVSAETNYLAWSLRALAGITLGAALVYCVKALSERARLISDTEVRSRQFAFDVDRATWLVEMYLESEKTGKPLAPDLVAAFSHGLFDVARAAPERSVALANLLENADSLKLSGGGMELTASGRRLRRSVSSADGAD